MGLPYTFLTQTIDRIHFKMHLHHICIPTDFLNTMIALSSYCRRLSICSHGEGRGSRSNTGVRLLCLLPPSHRACPRPRLCRHCQEFARSPSIRITYSTLAVFSFRASKRSTRAVAAARAALAEVARSKGCTKAITSYWHARVPAASSAASSRCKSCKPTSHNNAHTFDD